MGKSWVHGSVECRGRVVEVIQIHTVARGQKPQPLGWRARITVGAATIQTTEHHPTQEAAERAVCDACHELAGGRDELRAALAALVEGHDEEPKTLTAAEWDAARKAIAEAKGGAS